MSQKDKQKQEQAQKKQGDPKDPGETRFDQSTQGENPPVQVGNLESRQGKGRWGRLPKRVVEQMYDNGRRKLPEKYRMLLEDYFRKLPSSEK